MGAGMWATKGCFFIRAPKGELKKWAPLLETIHTSVKIDINWLSGEMQGQKIRTTTYREVKKTVEDLDRDITAHRQQTNAEIQNDMYLTLTDQEEYINPYTNEVEIGTNQ